MPLILAIESDKRQAAQLTAMARSRLKAELVLADSAERALQALGERIPDLILTPALLSPRDEDALTGHLRRLNSKAAHVQTLAVPLLAGVEHHGSMGRTVLSALRREKQGPAIADGCDPDVFAEQVQAYLERAAMERKAREHEPEHVSAPARHEQPPAPDQVAQPQVRRTAADASPDAPAIDVQAWQAEWAVPEIAAAVAEMTPPEPVAPDRILEVTAPPVFAPKPRHHRVAPAEFAEVDLGALLDDPEPAAARASVPAAATEAAKGELVAMPPPAPEPVTQQTARQTTPTIEPAPSPEASIMAAVERLMHADAPPAAPAADLRLPSLKPEPSAQPHGASTTSRERKPPALPTMKTTVQPPKKKVRRPRPLQDEWGLFDPAQCGFAALVARLEEVTGPGTVSDGTPAETAPDPLPVRGGTRVAR